MAVGLGGVLDNISQYVDENSDPRTKNWFMVGSIPMLATVLALYIYFCKVAGPRYMKDRKPYQLQRVMMFYNIFQILFSIFILYEGLVVGWWNYRTASCKPTDYSYNPLPLRVAGAYWWYYMAKLTELLDTVFFVLRKKNNQVTGLHLWHHTLMPVTGFIGTRYFAGGHGGFVGVLNSFVHVVMYTYYLLAGLGPQFQKYLWWKKYLTILQLVQFILMFLHCVQPLIRECPFHKTLSVLLCGNQLAFIWMFTSFYIRTYTNERKKE